MRKRTQAKKLNEERQSDVYDPYYSPPETFMPSDPLDVISVEQPQAPNTAQSVERLVSWNYQVTIYNTEFQQRSGGSHHQTDLLKAAVPKWNFQLQRH